METVVSVICLIIAIASYIVSYFQFREKGTLFNNAYLYASEQERERMNKTPYYRQSGVVFSLIGTIFVLEAVELAMKWNWIFYLVIAISIVTVFYAIASSVKIGIQNK